MAEPAPRHVTAGEAAPAASTVPGDVPALRRNRDFLRYFLARAQSQLGSAVTDAAVPLIAAATLHASAAQVGLLVGLQSAAQLTARPLAAVMAERPAHRPAVMAAMEWCRFASIGLVPLLWWLGDLSIVSLTLLTTVTAVFTGWFGAYSAPYLVGLVSERDLDQAGSAIGTAMSTADVAGPGLAGLLMKAVPLPVVLLADAASYLFGGAMLSRLPRAEAADADGEPADGTLRGFFEIFTGRLLTPVVGLTAVTVLNGVVMAVIAIYGTRDLALAPAVFAWLLSAGAVGGIAGAACAGLFARRLPGTRRFTIALMLMALSLGGLPLARPGAGAIVALFCYELFGSFGAALYMISLITTIPTIVRPSVIARSMAAASLIPEAGVLVGALAGGVLADALGIRRLLAAAAVTALAVTAVTAVAAVVSRSNPRTAEH